MCGQIQCPCHGVIASSISRQWVENRRFTTNLQKDEKRIDIVDRFEHAKDLFNDNRYYRYGYLAFPFAVPGGAFRAALGGGEVIDPYRDQSGYATDAFVASRDWCAVENGEFGVALFQRDSLLTE